VGPALSAPRPVAAAAAGLGRLGSGSLEGRQKERVDHEILDRLGSSAEQWQARLERLRQGRLLGRYLAATRQRLRGRRGSGGEASAQPGRLPGVLTRDLRNRRLIALRLPAGEIVRSSRANDRAGPLQSARERESPARTQSLGGLGSLPAPSRTDPKEAAARDLLKAFGGD